MKTCKHYWEYENLLYGGGRGGVLVRRRCGKCHKEQVGRVSHWREPREDEFELPFEKATH
ncbi:hypothetical protein ES708_02730 [subsurface metagenome]